MQNYQIFLWSGLIGLGSALIGTLSSLAVTYLQRRSEERKHYRELIVNATLKYWEKRSDYVAQNGEGYIFPLSVYVLYTKKLCDVFLDEKITDENMLEKLQEVEEMGREAERFIAENHLRR